VPKIAKSKKIKRKMEMLAGGDMTSDSSKLENML